MKKKIHGYPPFSSTSRALIAKHLSNDIFRRLEKKATRTGFTLEQAIASGIANPDSSLGIYAGDPESYSLFQEIFNPIILDYHHPDKGLKNNPRKMLNHSPDYTLQGPLNPDPGQDYILSTRIRVARNLNGFSFTTAIQKKERTKVEEIAVKALHRLDSNYKGTYFPIKRQSIPDHGILQNKKLIFNNTDRFQAAAGIHRDWPHARGVFVSDNAAFIVWINEEDHLRIISMDSGSDISTTFKRLTQALTQLESRLSFAFSKKLGYLTSCPSNIGTAMRAGVHIRLPVLSRNRDKLRKAADAHGLQIRGTQGEKSNVEDAVFDISNRRRLGISESRSIQMLHTGLVEIIALEKKLGR